MPLSPPFRSALSFLTYLPFIAFFHTHVASFMRVSGPSMYPFLNTSYYSSSRKDVVFVDRRDPAAGLKRGMVVAFWFVSFFSWFFFSFFFSPFYYVVPSFFFFFPPLNFASNYNFFESCNFSSSSRGLNRFA